MNQSVLAPKMIPMAVSLFKLQEMSSLQSLFTSPALWPTLKIAVEKTGEIQEIKSKLSSLMLTMRLSYPETTLLMSHTRWKVTRARHLSWCFQTPPSQMPPHVGRNLGSGLWKILLIILSMITRVNHAQTCSCFTYKITD